MSNIIPSNRSVVQQDSISAEFMVYCWGTKEGNKYFTTPNFFISKKHQYFINEVEKILKTYKIESLPLHNLDINFIIKFLNDREDIPDRYKPTIIKLREKHLDFKQIIYRKFSMKNKLKKYMSHKKNYKPHHFNILINEIVEEKIKFDEWIDSLVVYEIRFKESLISLLKQLKNDKYLHDEIIYEFFTEYTKQSGMNFDEWVDKKANKLIEEFFGEQ